jgi:MoxR-like ATPase
VESIVAGIKIHAHAQFRMVSTMNDDASTFELPEYIHSRLQPQIFIDFPERDEEYHILRENLPFAEERILHYVTDFLQQAHAADERYTVRDGINIARFAMKLKNLATERTHELEALETSITEILGEEALRYARKSRPTPS